MAGVVTGTFLSPAVSELMREYLEWPMELEGNREQFRAFGAKGGSLAGVLTEAAYLVPTSGSFAGTPRIVALFMREMPLSSWLQLQQTFGQQRFYVEVATDEEFATRVSDSLKT